MECPRCRQDNPPQAKFCLKCGAGVTLTCLKCSTELPVGAGFCFACGQPVGSPSAAQHPQWSENLLREPNAQVQIGADQRPYRARLASSEEVARAWPRLVEFWPAYDRYKERSGRNIRVFVLEPCRPPSNLEAETPARG